MLLSIPQYLTEPSRSPDRSERGKILPWKSLVTPAQPSELPMNLLRPMLVAWESNLGMLSKHAPSHTPCCSILLWKNRDYLPRNRQRLVMQVPHPLVPQLAQVAIVMHQGSNNFTLQPVQITFSNPYYLSCI
jgi:hypothetical protein